MIFTRLTLNNFKSYDNAIIDFEKGISVIVGENGAGKSTIFEAINFALFKQYKTKKITDLVRNGSDGNMFVELEFISEGVEYKITRETSSASIKSTILKKSDEGDFYFPVCQGDKEVANQIESILEMDGNLFLNAIYVRQGEIADLVDKKPAEKKHLIGKLLGLDSLEKSWKQLAPYISIYENKKAELSGKLANANELNEDYDKLSVVLNDLKEKGLDLEKSIEELKENLNEIKQEKINLDRSKEIYEDFLIKQESLKVTKESLEKDKKGLIERLDKIKESEGEIDRLDKYVTKLPLYVEFEKSSEKVIQFKKEEELYKKDLEKISIQNNILSKEESNYNDYLNLKDEINELNESKNQLEKDLAVLSKLKNDKEKLLSKMMFKKQDIQKLFSEIKDQLVSLGFDKIKADKITNIISLENVYNEHHDALKDEISNVENKILKRKEDLARFSQSLEGILKPLKELEAVKNQCPVCKSPLSKNQKIKLISTYYNQLEVSEKEVLSAEKDLKELSIKKKDLDEKLEGIQDLYNNFAEYNQKLISLTEDLEKLQELDKTLESHEANNSELGKLILTISNKEKLSDDLKTSHDNYTNAKAALEVLDSEDDIKNNLNQVESNINLEVSKMKEAIENDVFLKEDINKEDLATRIEDLKSKKEKYDNLIGFVSNKEVIETQLNDKKEEFNLLLKEIENLEEKIESTKFDEDKYQKISTKFDELNDKLKESQIELSSIKGQSKELISRVKKLKEQINSNKKYNEELNNVTEFIKILNDIRDLFSKNSIQRELRNRSRPLIQKYAKDFFSQFNFNYSDLLIDEDYDVSIIGPEGETSLNMVSGGEKIAIALSLRLGITQAISKGNTETILLDEPTIFLDSARRHELINLIKELTVLPQMIIVTHEPQLEVAADNLIKIEKVNGISKVS